MLNEFGKFTRKLRVDKSERMADMAAKLGVSSAFLSSIERGKSPAPRKIVKALIDVYNLDGFHTLLLRCAMAKLSCRVVIETKTTNGKFVASALCDRLDSLTNEQTDDILKILQDSEGLALLSAMPKNDRDKSW